MTRSTALKVAPVATNTNERQMNRGALLVAYDYIIRAQKILEMEGCVIAEDLADPVAQLRIQMDEIK